MDINSFFEATKADIERRLKDNVEKYDNPEKLAYLLSHGKRLRPLLSVLVFRACGGCDAKYKEALDLGVAIELQHSASLVHDDIIDGDFLRRSRSTYHRVYGIEDAILTGHRAIVLGFKNVLRHDPAILETFLEVWDSSLKGETQEIEVKKIPFSEPIADLECNEKLYFDVIVNKTASLFAGASKIGSQVAGVSKGAESLFWEYGKYVGIAYQLADDRLDFDNGAGEILPISWIANKLDGKEFESFIFSLKEGASPLSALSGLKIDARSIFDEEIKKMQLIAERLARNMVIPKNQFTPLLLEAPRYVIDGSAKI